VNLKLVCGLLLAAGAAAGIWAAASIRSDDAPFVHLASPEEAAPLCPWRDPDGDLRRFFPGATRHVTETRILSAQRLELQNRLGRTPLPDETALQYYAVYAGSEPRVVAVGPDGAVRGVRLQRLREPEESVRALSAERWLARFKGVRAGAASWNAEALAAALPAAARTSGREIAEGIRSTLILYDTALRHGEIHQHRERGG
jgi:hypothetical protein